MEGYDGTGLVTCCETYPKVYENISKEEMVDMLVETVNSEDELAHVHDDISLGRIEIHNPIEKDVEKLSEYPLSHPVHRRRCLPTHVQAL